MTINANADEFVIERTFDAPRELVFSAWTDEQHLAQWWGPKGFALTNLKNALRPGGLLHYAMQPPGGDVMWGRWVYREIVPPERLVFVSSFSDPEGGLTRAPFGIEFPLEVLSTVTFTEANGKTTVTMRGVPINASDEERSVFASMTASMQQGWTGTLDQLADYLRKVA